MSKYTEIFKLKHMLEDEGISFMFEDRYKEDRAVLDSSELLKGLEFYQIIIFKDNNYSIDFYSKEDDDRLVSVIQGFGTYGEHEDLLEIQGLLTEEEEENSVKGYMTALEVMERVLNYYEQEE